MNRESGARTPTRSNITAARTAEDKLLQYFFDAIDRAAINMTKKEFRRAVKESTEILKNAVEKFEKREPR